MNVTLAGSETETRSGRRLTSDTFGRTRSTRTGNAWTKGPAVSVTVSAAEYAPSRKPPAQSRAWDPAPRGASNTVATSAAPRRITSRAVAGTDSLNDAVSESDRPSPLGEIADGKTPKPERVRLTATTVVAVTVRPRAPRATREMRYRPSG